MPPATETDQSSWECEILTKLPSFLRIISLLVDRSSLCRRTTVNICGTCDTFFAVCLCLLLMAAAFGVSRFKSLSDLPYLWKITQLAAQKPYGLSYKWVQMLSREMLGNVLRRGGCTWVFGGSGETLEMQSWVYHPCGCRCKVIGSSGLW